MKFYIGVTDYNWYTLLKNSNCEEVNFWKPGTTNFKAINTNEMFLFKLHSPKNFIVGGGFFVRYSVLPTFLAWDAFGIKNGTRNLKELNERVLKYKKKNRIDIRSDNIGCIILAEPFFFEEEDWIPIPENWSNSIVQGKTYLTEDAIGKKLFQQVNERLNKNYINEESYYYVDQNQERYGKDQIVKSRLGQGSFRILVTETYHRQCAITSEKTLPVLDAAHIKPYSDEGPHMIQNGILLRTDIHSLFDKGYMTVDTEHHVLVSNRLHEDFGNGKIYYAYHGKKLALIPDKSVDLPSKEYLQWHNNNMFLG